MKTQIKNLRVQIDGLAQLVETLGQPSVIVSMEDISDDISGELLKMIRDAPIAIMKLTDVKPIEYSFNYNLYECHKSLRLAKAWLGKVLGKLGEETPYKNDGKRKEVKDIEPPADAAKDVTDFPIVPDNWPDDIDKVPYVEKIDFLREEIKQLIDSFQDISSEPQTSVEGVLRFIRSHNEVFEMLKYSKIHLSEARFHLGFELQKIKEQEENK